MTLEEFNRFMLTHSSGRQNVPTIEVMQERVWTGLKQLAMDTTPLILTVTEAVGYTIIRKIGEDVFIRKPEKPKLGTAAALDIDEMLLDALAYYVLAGLEVSRAKTYMGMYYRQIDGFNEKLIETFLNVASNDSEKFRELP